MPVPIGSAVPMPSAAAAASGFSDAPGTGQTFAPSPVSPPVHLCIFASLDFECPSLHEIDYWRIGDLPAAKLRHDEAKITTTILGLLFQVSLLNSLCSLEEPS